MMEAIVYWNVRIKCITYASIFWFCWSFEFIMFAATFRRTTFDCFWFVDHK